MRDKQGNEKKPKITHSQKSDQFKSGGLLGCQVVHALVHVRVVVAGGPAEVAAVHRHREGLDGG